MNTNNSARKIFLVSLGVFVVSFLLAWVIGDTFTDNDYAILFAGPTVISLVYVVCSIFLGFSNVEAVKKWFALSLKWTIPLLVLFLIVSANVINAESGESDFLSYELLFVPLLIVSGLFVVYTPFYLHKKSKEFSHPTN